MGTGRSTAGGSARQEGHIPRITRKQLRDLDEPYPVPPKNCATANNTECSEMSSWLVIFILIET